MGGTGRKDPASGQSPGICPDTSRHPHCQPVGAAGSLPAYPQQHGLSDVLFHFREHPVRQGRPSLRLLFLDIKLEPAHQRAGHLSAGPDRRTGSESLCQPGSTGQISEWPYQGPRPLLYGNLTGHPQGIRRLFQGQRLPASRLHHRGGGTGKSRSTSHTGGSRTAAADRSHPGKEGTCERSIFHFS